MSILHEIQQSYSSKYQAYKDKKQSHQKLIDESEQKIVWHQRRIDRHKKKINNLDFPLWTENLVRPIIVEVAKLTPDIEWESDKRLCTFGLRRECPIFGTTKDGHTVGITFTPPHNGANLPYYDTGERKPSYQPGTIGEINGMNNVSKQIESIEELVAMIRRKEEEAIAFHLKKSEEAQNTNE